MEIKVNALVLRAADYNENDKILTLLTYERGKITAGIKGVKKAGAKLRFAAQPFCFAEYILAFRAGRYTVTGASENESFYDLRTDVNKFYAACAVLEATSLLTYEGDDCAPVFSECVKTLSGICGGGESAELIKYLLFLLKQSGYGIFPGGCRDCGKKISGDERVRFDMDAGAFTCVGCGSGAPASRSTFNTLAKYAGALYEEEYITDDGEKRALRLLREYFSYKTDSPLKSLSEYIRLL